MPVKRILFFAEGATMAHFVRPLALADSLRSEPYEVHFYAPRPYFRYLENRPFPTGELASEPASVFLANLAKGAPPFSSTTIRRYVNEDREIIRRVKPDLIIGDMRLSLPISAHLENTPLAVIFNAYWSPYARCPFIVPSVPVTRFLKPRWFSLLYRLAQPFAFRLHVAEMNAVRREFGIPDLPPDLRVMYTEGDHVLYADIPEFVPTYNAPSNHHYIGACPWTPPVPIPEWWNKMRGDARLKVFISLGSSGPLQVVPALLRALEKLSVSVVISTSGRDFPAATAGTYTASILPFTETAAASHIVVSHGGSGGLYPAIEAGIPVLGIPSNADQHLSTAVMQRNGAGLGIRVEDASEKRLSKALEALLDDPRYRESAHRWSTIFARYNTPDLFRRFLHQVFQ